MNPILSPEFFIPDGEMRIWPDGRAYLYGSSDIHQDTWYCSDQYLSFSSDDLVTWQAHGESFALAASHCPNAGRLFAPDCLYHNQRYHLFYCADDNSEGVASADSPNGPFTNAQAVKGADGDAIDPAVFKDDDGQIYLYWGQFQLRGARLSEDLSAIDPSSLHKELLSEAQHGFHEGPSMRKRNGIYYLVYTDISRGRATCLSYATARSPLGPFEKQGVIIDNAACDPQSWNNHGSIFEFQDQWYIVYHRSSEASHFNRRACIEPIMFDSEGLIAEVPMTTQGVSEPLNPLLPLMAYRACELQGQVRVSMAATQQCWLCGAEDGDSALFRYLDFTQPVTHLELTMASAMTGGKLLVELADGQELACVDIPRGSHWQDWQQVRIALKHSPSGIHGLRLRFVGPAGRVGDILSLRFIA